MDSFTGQRNTGASSGRQTNSPMSASASPATSLHLASSDCRASVALTSSWLARGMELPTPILIHATLRRQYMRLLGWYLRGGN